MHPTAKEFYQLTDGKAFIDKYSKGVVSPVAGRLMQEILVNCAMYDESILSKFETRYNDALASNQIAGEKLAAVGRLRKACSGLFQISREDLLTESQKFTPSFDGKSDPFSKSVNLALAQHGRTREENLADFESIVKSRDGVAYRNLAIFLSGAGAREEWTFGDGEARISPRVLGLALSSAPCYFDGECDRSQLLLDASCLLGGDLTRRCPAEANMLDAIRTNVLAPAEYQAMLRVLEWLRPGIEKGEWPPSLFILRKNST